VAQPLFPESRERPHLAELNDDPHPAGPPRQPHLAEVPGAPDLAEQLGQTGRLGQTEQPGQAGPSGPERALLPEPPERPVSGVRQVPAFRGRRPAAGQYADKDASEYPDKYPGGQDSPLPSRGSGWTVLSYLVAGMMAYGAIGWLVSRAVHQAVIFPVGMLFGLGISLGLVIYRYGRSSSSIQNQHAKETAREEPAGDR
jgi:ATP synthase protein I